HDHDSRVRPNARRDGLCLGRFRRDSKLQRSPMRLTHTLSIALSLAAVTTMESADAQTPAPATPPRVAPMALTITGWPDGGQIPAKFTQAGEQVSPKLDWTNVPAGTQSFVVNMLDPDVAIQKGTETQPHWIVWNIPGTATGTPEGVKAGFDLPGGAHQISASGPQYRGPGAPAGGPLHHYTFEV